MNLYEGSLYLESPEKVRIGIVAARFNDLVVSRLIDGAEDALLRHGVLPAQISLAKVRSRFPLSPRKWRRAASTTRSLRSAR